MRSRILAGLVLVGLGWVGVQVAQPYINSYHFEEKVRSDTNNWSWHTDVGTVQRQVVEQGRGMGFTINPDDVTVERVPLGYKVQVHYIVPVDLRVYKSKIDFDMVAIPTR